MYYHISSIKNKESILTNGIKSKSNEIFICNDIEQLSSIAIDQLGINEYSIFEIKEEGITGEFIVDKVADFGSDKQFLVSQDKIEPAFISFLKDEIYHYWDLAEITEIKKLKAMGRYSIEQLHKYVGLNEKWRVYYNDKYNTNVPPTPTVRFDP